MTDKVELKSLIRNVGKMYGFSNAEMREAYQVGLKQLPEALNSYRDVSTRYNLDSRDSRVTCDDCLNLANNGVCRKAEEMGDKRDYRPTPDTLRNCDQFKGKP